MKDFDEDFIDYQSLFKSIFPIGTCPIGINGDPNEKPDQQFQNFDPGETILACDPCSKCCCKCKCSEKQPKKFTKEYQPSW